MSFFRFLALADIIQTVRQSHSTTDTTQGSEPVLPLLQSLRSLALSDSLDTLAVTAYPLSLFLVFDIFLSVDIIKKHTSTHKSLSCIYLKHVHLSFKLLTAWHIWYLTYIPILFYSLHTFKHSPDLPLHVIRLWTTVHLTGLEVVLRFVAGLVLILFLSAAELGQTGDCVCACRQKQAITTLSGLRSPQLLAVSH